MTNTIRSFFSCPLLLATLFFIQVGAGDSTGALVNEFVAEDFSSGVVSGWILGTGSNSVTLGNGDVFAVGSMTYSGTSVVTKALQMQDYSPYATSSSPIRFHSQNAYNVLATASKIVQLNVDLYIDSAITSLNPNANLARSKTASASSVEAYSSNYAANAVDGVRADSSKWTGSNTDPSWFMVDLGDLYNVNKVILYWEPYAYGINYEIQTSTDASNWTTQAAVTGNSTVGTDAPLTYTFSAASARYVRMYGTSHNSHAGGWGFSLYEFEVYGSSDTVTTTTTTSGYAVTRMGIFDATTSGYLSTGNSISLSVDANSSTNNIAIVASSSSGALRNVATFSRTASALLGLHTYGLQVDYRQSTTTPVVSAYCDGTFIGQATLNGSEGVKLGGSGTSRGSAVRLLVEATSTATSGGNIWLDNVTLSAFDAAAIVIAAPSAAAPVVQSAVSRRAHGSLGDYDIPINFLSGSSAPPITAVECRSGGQANMVVTFDKAITAASATLISGTATIGTLSYNAAAKTVTIPVTGVTNAQKVQFRLTNIQSADGGTLPSVYLAFGYLIGDVTGDGYVTSPDAVQVRNGTGLQAGQAGYNLRADINADGYITSPDAVQVRNNTGKQLP
ncbi:MAG: hypothetical protein B9S32_14765 [Verrucomicrobia bacterium Tous-C9LFEB]|nr:MAG: hypothetical protein B9S32_14765 [Verrucomicrobia bacterium Tous-C9LFEB]